MEITSIEPQIKARGRVNIFADKKFLVGIDEKLLIDLNLYKGRELTNEDIKNLQEAEELSKCLAKAYHFLSYRQRSEKEMTDKLREKYSDKTVSETIIKLKSYNYINDQEFARTWISSRSANRGKKALAFELKRKGLAKETIEEALESYSKKNEADNALNLILAKSKYQNLSRDEAYQKVGSFLARRGFGYDAIKKVVSEIAKPK